MSIGRETLFLHRDPAGRQREFAQRPAAAAQRQLGIDPALRPALHEGLQLRQVERAQGEIEALAAAARQGLEIECGAGGGEAQDCAFRTLRADGDLGPAGLREGKALRFALQLAERNLDAAGAWPQLTGQGQAQGSSRGAPQIAGGLGSDRQGLGRAGEGGGQSRKLGRTGRQPLAVQPSGHPTGAARILHRGLQNHAAVRDAGQGTRCQRKLGGGILPAAAGRQIANRITSQIDYQIAAALQRYAQQIGQQRPPIQAAGHLSGEGTAGRRDCHRPGDL